MGSKKQITQWYQESPGIDTKGKPGIVFRPLIDIHLNYKHGQMVGLTALAILGQKGFFDQFEGIELRRPEEKMIFTIK